MENRKEKRGRGEETKQRILEEAIELISQKGYNGVSIRELARSVGIKESSIYNHYGSKDEILTSIFNLFTSGMEGTVLTEEEIDERISALSPEEFWKVGTSRFMAATGDPRMEKISLIVFQEMFRDGRARDIALRELFSRQQELVELIFTKMKGRGIVGQVDTKALANAYSYPMLALRFEYNLLKFWGMDTGPVEEKMAQHIRFIAGVARPQDELN
jgi:AcrR family transcriptional regulator